MADPDKGRINLPIGAVSDLPRHAADCSLATTHHLTCTCGALTKWIQEHKDAARQEHADG